MAVNKIVFFLLKPCCRTDYRVAFVRECFPFTKIDIKESVSLIMILPNQWILSNIDPLTQVKVDGVISLSID